MQYAPSDQKSLDEKWVCPAAGRRLTPGVPWALALALGLELGAGAGEASWCCATGGHFHHDESPPSTQTFLAFEGAVDLLFALIGQSID